MCPTRQLVTPNLRFQPKKFCDNGHRSSSSCRCCSSTPSTSPGSSRTSTASRSGPSASNTWPELSQTGSKCLSICLSVHTWHCVYYSCLSIYLSIILSALILAYPTLCLSMRLFYCLNSWLFICLALCLSILSYYCLPIHVFVHLSVHLYLHISVSFLLVLSPSICLYICLTYSCPYSVHTFIFLS